MRNFLLSLEYVFKKNKNDFMILTILPNVGMKIIKL